MENIEINNNLYKDIILSLQKNNDIYSINRIKGFICGTLKIDIEDIDEAKLKEALGEYFVSLNDNILLYPTIVKLNSTDTIRYFIAKIAKEKTVITKKDVKKYLRCLPLEKRMDCIKILDNFFGKEDFIIMDEPEELYILNNPEEFEKDSKYVVQDNLEDFTVQNKYVNYSDQKSKKNTFRRIVNAGVGILCTGFVSVLSLMSNNNNLTNNMNREAIVISNSKIDSASDYEILEWFKEAMKNHYNLIDTTTLDCIKNTYNKKINALHLDVIYKYCEYIKAVAPVYYYNLFRSFPEDDIFTEDNILNMFKEVGVFADKDDAYQEHEEFINSVKIFNDYIIKSDDRFESFAFYTDFDNAPAYKFKY